MPKLRDNGEKRKSKPELNQTSGKRQREEPTALLLSESGYCVKD